MTIRTKVVAAVAGLAVASGAGLALASRHDPAPRVALSPTPAPSTASPSATPTATPTTPAPRPAATVREWAAPRRDDVLLGLGGEGAWLVDVRRATATRVRGVPTDGDYDAIVTTEGAVILAGEPTGDYPPLPHEVYLLPPGGTVARHVGTTARILPSVDDRSVWYGAYPFAIAGHLDDVRQVVHRARPDGTRAGVDVAIPRGWHLDRETVAGLLLQQDDGDGWAFLRDGRVTAVREYVVGRTSTLLATLRTGCAATRCLRVRDLRSGRDRFVTLSYPVTNVAILPGDAGLLAVTDDDARRLVVCNVERERCDRTEVTVPDAGSGTTLSADGGTFYAGTKAGLLAWRPGWPAMRTVRFRLDTYALFGLPV